MFSLPTKAIKIIDIPYKGIFARALLAGPRFSLLSPFVEGFGVLGFWDIPLLSIFIICLIFPVLSF